jgi:hypothetical protein
MKHQMGGWNSGPKGHDFPDKLKNLFIFFYHENWTLLWMQKLVWFLDWMPGENFQSGFMEVFMVDSRWLVLPWELNWKSTWKSTLDFNWWVRIGQHWKWPQSSFKFSQAPTTFHCVPDFGDQIDVEQRTWKNYVGLVEMTEVINGFVWIQHFSL